MLGKLNFQKSLDSVDAKDWTQDTKDTNYFVKSFELAELEELMEVEELKGLMELEELWEFEEVDDF